MATVSSPSSIDLVERNHSVWSGRFGPAERQRMRDEDSTAFRTVSLELVSIVSLGFILVAITVGAILFAG